MVHRNKQRIQQGNRARNSEITRFREQNFSSRYPDRTKPRRVFNKTEGLCFDGKMDSAVKDRLAGQVDRV